MATYRVENHKGKWCLVKYGGVKPREMKVIGKGPAAKQAADRRALELTVKHATACLGEADTEITFAEAVERYLKVKARRRSYYEKRRILGHLVGYFGGATRVKDITPDWISRLKEDRLGTRSVRRKDAAGNPTPLSAASINRPLAELRSLLRMARDVWGLLDKVPMFELEEEPQERVRWLEPAQEAKLLEACGRADNPELRVRVIVASESGMRKGEVDRLDWDKHIDLGRGVFKLEGPTETRREGTKSGKRREVPMRQAAYEALMSLPEPHSGPVWKNGDCHLSYPKAVKEAGIEDFTFHDLRHHFASWYMMNGGNPVALQKILGHATYAMTEKYAHLAPNFLRGEMEKTERKPGAKIAPSSDRVSPDGAVPERPSPCRHPSVTDQQNTQQAS